MTLANGLALSPEKCALAQFCQAGKDFCPYADCKHRPKINLVVSVTSAGMALGDYWDSRDYIATISEVGPPSADVAFVFGETREIALARGMAVITALRVVMTQKGRL